MQYVSTRDAGILKNAKDAILEGISPDGGLFAADWLSDVHVDLDTILSQNYLENAVYILSGLLPDYTKEELEACVLKAYSGTFSSADITPVKKVDDIYVLELFHGPTSAFKDVALTLLPQLMSVALEQAGKKALILTATSGDTGKAALSGFADADNISIAVFYPDQKVSKIQYTQMASQKGSNVKVFGVRGNFDDAQSQVKKLFLDPQLNAFAADNNVLLSSANSINIGRLVPQIVYYFEAYKQLVQEGVIEKGEPVSFSVPTGNFGDVLAGYYASLMGLPVKEFIVASNANNVLTDFFETGTYDRNRDFVQTISPSMDILISSNLERLLYYASGKDHEKVKAWMDQLAKTGSYTIDPEMLAALRRQFKARYYDDAATKAVIKDVFDKTGEVLDPHSAIAYAAAREACSTPVIALATASPYKFCKDVCSALGMEEEDEWQAMSALHAASHAPVPENLAALRSAEILHKDVIDIDEMKPRVQSFLKEQI